MENHTSRKKKFLFTPLNSLISKSLCDRHRFEVYRQRKTVCVTGNRRTRRGHHLFADRVSGELLFRP